MMQSHFTNEPITVFIDENITPKLAQAFNIIQTHLNREEQWELSVKSISEVFGRGSKDEDWIPKVGSIKGIVITQDQRIQTTKVQRELYLANNVGIIFLHSPKNGMRFWEMFKHLTNHWDEIKSVIKKNNPPFAYRQPGKNHRFERWD